LKRAVQQKKFPETNFGLNLKVLINEISGKHLTSIRAMIIFFFFGSPKPTTSGTICKLIHIEVSKIMHLEEISQSLEAVR
jgi:hypothetical protein